MQKDCWAEGSGKEGQAPAVKFGKLQRKFMAYILQKKLKTQKQAS